MSEIREVFKETTKELIADCCPELKAKTLSQLSSHLLSLALKIDGKAYHIAIVDTQRRLVEGD